MTQQLLLNAALLADLPLLSPILLEPSHSPDTSFSPAAWDGSSPNSSSSSGNSAGFSPRKSLTPINSSSDDSAYFGSPPVTPTEFSDTPSCTLTYHPTSYLPAPAENAASQASLPRDLMDFYPANFSVDPSYPLNSPYPAAASYPGSTPYSHPAYLENLQNKIMRRKGSSRSDKEKSTLNYLKTLAREERFEEMFVIITNFVFSKKNHSWLQTLWLRGHYAREMERLGRALQPADRLRLRRLQPFPSSISEPDDYESQRVAKDFLKVFYGINEYPSPGQKMMLSARCKMTYHQVNSWFKNRRARDREQPEQIKVSPEQLDDTLDLLMVIIEADKDIEL